MTARRGRRGDAGPASGGDRPAPRRRARRPRRAPGHHVGVDLDARRAAPDAAHRHGHPGRRRRADGVRHRRGAAGRPAACRVPERDVSVGEFVRERPATRCSTGSSSPLLGGVYAGHADALSLAAAGAADPEAARRRSCSPVPRRRVAAPDGGPVFAGLDGGVGQLPAALAERLEADVRTGRRASAASSEPTAGWLLALAAGDETLRRRRRRHARAGDVAAAGRRGSRRRPSRSPTSTYAEHRHRHVRRSTTTSSCRGRASWCRRSTARSIKAADVLVAASGAWLAEPGRTVLRASVGRRRRDRAAPSRRRRPSPTRRSPTCARALGHAAGAGGVARAALGRRRCRSTRVGHLDRSTRSTRDRGRARSGGLRRHLPRRRHPGRHRVGPRPPCERLLADLGD